MDASQVVLFIGIAILAVGIGFGGFFIIKSIAVPKKVSGIKKLIKQNKNLQAIKLARSILAKSPKDYVAHYYLGKAYLASGKAELALMEFKTVNQNAIFGGEIRELDFRKMISDLYMKFNQQAEALKEYLLLTKLEPTNAENYYKVGTIYDAGNRSDLSVGFYKRAIDLNSRHVKAHAALGLALYKGKQLAEAKKEIDLAISIDPESYSTYYYRGKVEKESKDYSAAVKDFEKATRDADFRQRALVEKGSCFMAANSMDRAMEEFEKAVKYAKNDSAQETLYARYFLAACYEKNHKIDQAIEQWEKIVAKVPNFKDVPAKLTQYKDLQANDSMKEYLTGSSEAFVEICKKVLLQCYSMAAQSATLTKWGCKISATEQKNDDWMNVRKQAFLFQFYRITDPIDDAAVRKVADEVKEQGFSKAYLLTSSSFSHTAAGFAENRPIELVAKEKLEELLTRAGV